MKTKSILRIFAALTLVLGFAMTGLGQNFNNLDAKATVVASITVLKVQDLTFGYLAASQVKSVSLDDVVTGGIAGGTTKHGIFSVAAGTGTNLMLTWTAMATTLTGPSTTMGITYNAKWNTDNAMGGTGATVNTGLGATTTITSNANATFYVHLAGEVTAGAVQETGLYSTNIILTATYN